MKKDSKLKQADLIRDTYQSRLPLLELVAKCIEEQVKEALSGYRHIDRVSFRVKSLNSFCKKVLNKATPYTAPLVEIEDQIAGRILVFFTQDIEIIEKRLITLFPPIEQQRKAPERDAEFGYESNHLVCRIPYELVPEEWAELEDAPRTFEIQVRTLFMHAWAEPQHDLGYKGSSKLDSDMKRELAWAAASAWGADQALQRVMDKIKMHSHLDH